MNNQLDGKIDRWANRQTDSQIGKQIDGQKDNGQLDRYTNQ